MSNTVILALDPATHTGYATSLGFHGSIDLSKAASRPGALYKFIMLVHTRMPIRLIAYEVASFGAFNRKSKGGGVQWRTMAFHNELRGVIKMAAAEIGAKLLDVSPSTIKSVATGKGNATKADVMRACELTLGITPADDNEADALMILEIAKQWEKRPEILRSPKAKPKRTRAKKGDPQQKFI